VIVNKYIPLHVKYTYCISTDSQYVAVGFCLDLLETYLSWLGGDTPLHSVDAFSIWILASSIASSSGFLFSFSECWHVWGTGIRGLMRHGIPSSWHTLPRGNQELLVVRDKVGRPPGELGVKQVHGM